MPSTTYRNAEIATNFFLSFLFRKSVPPNSGDSGSTHVTNSFFRVNFESVISDCSLHVHVGRASTAERKSESSEMKI